MKRFENKTYISFFWIGLLSVLLVPAWYLSVNNDNWLPPDHPQELNLNYVSDEFSPGDDLVIGFPMARGFFNYKAMERFSRIEQGLVLYLGRDLISHRSALSATRLSATRIANNKSTIEIESFEAAHQRGAFASLKDYQKAFDTSPYAGRLLAKDYKIAAVHLSLDTRGKAIKRAVVMDKVRAYLAFEGLAAGKDYHFIGKAVVKNEMNSQTQKALPVLLLAAVLILGCFLMLALGKVLPALFALGVAGLCVFGALSAQVLLGHEMSVITIILPVLAGVIALAHGLHIIFYQADGVRTRQETMNYMWRPCLLANLTTAIGMGSFVFSGLVPLKNFGWDSMLTLTLLYLTVCASFLFLPFWQVKRALAFTNLMGACHTLSDKYKKEISYAGLGLFVVLALGLVRFTTETNFLEVFFKPQSQIRQDFALADKHLGGSGVVDVIVRQKEQDRFKQLDAFDKINALAKSLSKHPQVNYAEAMDIPVGLAHRAFTGKKVFPNSDSQLAQELLFLELSRNEAKDDILSPYVNFDYSASRIHLRTPDLNSQAIAKMVKEIELSAKQTEGLGEVILTGFNFFMFALGEEVLATQISSFMITMSIIFVIFIFIFGLKLGAIGFISNIVPIGILLGLIAWLGISFDMVMVLVAAITLGLMVDDSIHFLHHFRAELAKGASNSQARRLSLIRAGSPILLTSLLFCAGFGVFLLSDLALLVKFGIWTMVGLAIDGVCSLLFLPALLAFWSKEG